MHEALHRLCRLSTRPSAYRMTDRPHAPQSLGLGHSGTAEQGSCRDRPSPINDGEFPMKPELRAALDVIFAADSEIYANRGFMRRIGFGKKPALIHIDLANAWTKEGYPFTCDDMET